MMLLLAAGTSFAGEMLAPLSARAKRPAIQPLNNAPLAAAADTLALPFFDDFSAATNGIPDQNKWLDRTVFINNTYGINQPTIGAATFDILNEKGELYEQTNSYGFTADSLTSKPIRLLPADTLGGVFLSFYFQPGGYGDMPEREDSLVLQFRLNDTTWISAWRASTDKTLKTNAAHVMQEFMQSIDTQIYTLSDTFQTKFYRAMVPIPKRFCYSGFQLRFVNYASRATSEIEGMTGNCDTWNLDMVYLNRNRTIADTVMIDVALQQPVKSILKGYESMPWRHLKLSTRAQREQLFTGGKVLLGYNVANLAKSASSFTTSVNLRCVQGGALNKGDRGGHNIQADTVRSDFEHYLSSEDILSPSATQDSVAFDIKLYIDSYNANPGLRSVLVANDTSTYEQKFYTCYSYDDGTAENGYGVFGNSASRARIAVQYYSYLADTLSSVYIYFNSTQDGGNLQPFTLSVWNDVGGAPGQQLYSESNHTAEFDSLNSFVCYKLTRKVVVNGLFYVGIVQQSNALLNIGFDKNRAPAGKLFVDEGNGWVKSAYDGVGALMIRPSFAPFTWDETTGAPREKTTYTVVAYPNPADEELYLKLPSELQDKNISAKIISYTGRTLLHRVDVTDVINVSGLPQGAYLLQLLINDKPVAIQCFLKR
jgi:hypothetical protein